jgi:hypothetical protein
MQVLHLPTFDKKFLITWQLMDFKIYSNENNYLVFSQGLEIDKNYVNRSQESAYSDCTS